MTALPNTNNRLGIKKAHNVLYFKVSPKSFSQTLEITPSLCDFFLSCLGGDTHFPP